MSILIALCERGLAELPGLHPRACPLDRVELLSPCGGAAVDAAGRLCAAGGVIFACPGGVEAAACWQGNVLLLSGETDALSLYGPGGELTCLCPAGVYPRDLCLLPEHGLCAVSGGAEGTVSLLHLPGLEKAAVFRVPGSPCFLAQARGRLYVLSSVGEEEVHSLLCSISLRTGHVQQLLALPGLPGCLAADGDGTLWAGITERLAHVGVDPVRLLSLRGGFGLIRRLMWDSGSLVAADPVLGCAMALSARGRGECRVLYRGEVRDVSRALPAKGV